MTLRVLHVIGGLQLGGAETLLFRLTQRSSAFEHEVVALAGRDWYSPLLEKGGVRVHHLGVGSIRSLPTAIGSLNRIIRESRADVVQTWMYAANVVGGITARRIGIPVVWGIHTSSLDPVGVGSRLFAYGGGLLAGSVPAFVINCSARSAEMHAKMGYSAAPGKVIHNGYDPQAFFPDECARGRLRETLGIAPDVFLIGSIGRWAVQKDFPTLLQALRIAADGGVPLFCVIIGRDLDRSNREFEVAIERHGCRELVLPLGARGDVPDLARILDLHVLASCGGEAFPNVVAETMLSATPNAVTDVGDSAFMVQDTGWIVSPRDARQLAAAITNAWKEWRGERSAWERRRTMARARIQSNFSFEQMSEAYEAVWRTVARIG